jgi:hypothetical protein
VTKRETKEQRVTTKQLLLASASQRFSASSAQLVTSLRFALDHDPLFCGFTELGIDSDMRTARKTVESAGYHFVGDTRADCGVAVHPSVTLLSEGYQHVHGGHLVANRNDRWYARGITWARGLVDDDEQLDVTFGEFHTITYRSGSKARKYVRELMAKRVAELLNENSRGGRLAFAVGDTNEDDDPGSKGAQASIWNRAGLVSLWDEVQQYPATIPGAHVKTIDWLLRPTHDKRAKPSDFKVVNVPGVDHHLVLATYDVEVKS